jgi:hypothetical protein
LESVGQQGQCGKHHASGEKVDRAILMCRDDWRESAAGLTKGQRKRTSEMLIEKNDRSDLYRPSFLALAAVIRVLEAIK